MDKISPIKSRLLKFIDVQGITKLEFCEKTKISYANLRGKSLLSEIGGDKIAEILSVYDNISPDWLLTGQGPMLRGDAHPSQTETEAPIPIAIAAPPGIGIPLIPTEAFAGAGQENFKDLQIEQYYYVEEFKHADFMIRVKGSSMYPKYSSGDVIACKIIKETLFFQWNRIYAVCTDSQGVMVKRVQESTAPDHITLVSDNPKYAPFDVPKSDIIAIALVIGVIRVE